jgi:hypothetical protein
VLGGLGLRGIPSRGPEGVETGRSGKRTRKHSTVASSQPGVKSGVVPAFKPPFDIIHRIAQETKKAARIPNLPVQLCSSGRTRSSDREVDKIVTVPDRRHYPLPASNPTETAHSRAAWVTIAILQPCNDGSGSLTYD